jgi:hypothetical protein
MYCNHKIESEFFDPAPSIIAPLFTDPDTVRIRKLRRCGTNVYESEFRIGFLLSYIVKLSGRCLGNSVTNVCREI